MWNNAAIHSCMRPSVVVSRTPKWRYYILSGAGSFPMVHLSSRNVCFLTLDSLNIPRCLLFNQKTQVPSCSLPDCFTSFFISYCFDANSAKIGWWHENQKVRKYTGRWNQSAKTKIRPLEEARDLMLINVQLLTPQERYLTAQIKPGMDTM